MAKCENCYHKDVCIGRPDVEEYGCKCEDYKDKSLIVEIAVRCKDCRMCKEAHYEDEGEPPIIKWICRFSNYSKQPDDFCNYGMKKETDDERKAD